MRPLASNSQISSTLGTFTGLQITPFFHRTIYYQYTNSGYRILSHTPPSQFGLNSPPCICVYCLYKCMCECLRVCAYKNVYVYVVSVRLALVIQLCRVQPNHIQPITISQTAIIQNSSSPPTNHNQPNHTPPNHIHPNHNRPTTLPPSNEIERERGRQRDREKAREREREKKRDR